MRHRVLLVGVVLGALMSSVGAAGASAAKQHVTRSVTDSITVDWTAVGVRDGADGDLHVGSLLVSDQPGADFVEGFEFDYECPDGFVPTAAGRDAVVEAEAAGCEWLGDRYVEGGDVTVHVRSGLRAARVTGTVVDVRGAVIPVDLRLTAVAPKTYDIRRDIAPGLYRRYTRTSNRDAAVHGTIGDVDLDDVAVSGGDITRVRYVDVDLG